MLRSIKILTRELSHARDDSFIQPSLLDPPGIKAADVRARHPTRAGQKPKILPEIAAALRERRRVKIQSLPTALKRGELSEFAAASMSLIPVVLAAPSDGVSATDEADAKEQSALGGSIHIELPGKAIITVERGADPSLLRSILESLRR